MDIIQRKIIEIKMENWLLAKFTKAEILEILARRSIYSGPISVYDVKQWLLDREQKQAEMQEAQRQKEQEQILQLAKELDSLAKEFNASQSFTDKAALGQKLLNKRAVFDRLRAKGLDLHKDWEKRQRYYEKLEKDYSKQLQQLETEMEQKQC